MQRHRANDFVRRLTEHWLFPFIRAIAVSPSNKKNGNFDGDSAMPKIHNRKHALLAFYCHE